MELLQSCINRIVQRHEVLRTSFQEIAREPVQVIAPELNISIRTIDLTGLPGEEERQAEIAALTAKDVRQPFNLKEPPLLRITLFTPAPDEYVLLAVMHHIISDGWSLGIFVHELTELYAAFSAGKDSPLPGLAIQYGDYAMWQRQRLQGEALRSQLAWWEEQLAGAPAELALPVDHDYPETQTYQGKKFTIHFSPSLTASVRALAASEEVTLFMALLAAWKILLCHHAKQFDVVVGTAIAGRNQSEIEPLIGFFVNTLPLRTDLSGDPELRELLRRVREVCLKAYAHQELPFEKLVERLCPRRDHARPAIVQAMFVLENAPLAELRLADLKVAPVAVDSGSAKFELALLAQEDGESISCSFEYNTALFEETTIHRMAAEYESVLRQMTAQPTLHLSALHEALPAAEQRKDARSPLSGSTERHTALAEFSVTGARPLPEAGIHELFERQAERTPDAPALVAAPERLTYRDVNRRANRVAHELRRRGIGVGSRVAIFMERSAEMFVAVLAVLKAGAAYVPLNVQHPGERTRFVLSDAGPSAVLTQERLAATLPASSARIIPVDTLGKNAGNDEVNFSFAAGPENPAYIVYTSGSTGQPKGSIVPHRALVNHALQMTELYDLGPGRRMLQFFPLSFDASAEDIFPSLISGATLISPPDSFTYSPQELLAFCDRHEVTTLHLPVVLWHHLAGELSHGKLALPSHVRTLSVGGESPSLDALVSWNMATGGRVAFRNMYGPTEATITATAYCQDAPEPLLEQRSRVPIGRPLENISVYLLDGSLEPVPVGAPGELHIGGIALAHGYVNQPGLTAEKFIPDPFSAAPGARLYKTGDLAQFAGNGEIEFLGRMDHQIKLRGARVELEEIERILVQHPAIKDAVIAVHGNGTGDKRLAAYFTFKPAQQATAKQIRSYIKHRLPDYMLPSWFVALNSLPLTSSGKIDRLALPAPSAENLGLEQEYVAPRTAVEQIVAAAFTEVLGKERVGILDDFFESGGHSLLAIQLVSHLRETFQVEVALKKIFANPTVAGVAAALLEEESSRARVERTAELTVKLAAISDDQAESMLEKSQAGYAKERMS